LPTKILSRFLLGLLLALSPMLDAAKKPAKPAPPKAESKPAEPAKPPEPKADTLAIAYLGREDPNPPPAPFFEPAAADRGVQGARLGILDDNTTGRFTRQNFTLRETVVPADGDVAAAFKTLVAEGQRHILLNLPADLIAQLAGLPEAQGVLLYDVGSRDDALRAEGCRANVLHLLPSRAMRADALAQYFAKKRWKDWFLAVGPTAGDRLYAEAVKRAARKFGAKVVAEKTWEHRFDERRTPESEVPVFTQGPDYDVLVVADETGLFGDVLPYRTWQPRPVAGTQGLVPTAWHRTHELWGALQLQNRFRDQAGRWMTEEDYGAWLAVRAVGEAATRTRTIDFDPIKAFLLSAEFTLAGFKGVPLSFRRWDLQLRQPVLLAADRSLVAVAPIEGYLHPRNELDTLGFDEAETKCRLQK
jgi:ABC transporter substrate binding protein (PQQ-dependent alcohol dehydrogenase system)